VIKGVRTIPDLSTDELLNLSRTLAARLASLKNWQELTNVLRSILHLLALCKPWPSPAAQSDPRAAGMACATDPQADGIASAQTLLEDGSCPSDLLIPAF
jgi:hypothetical protein